MCAEVDAYINTRMCVAIVLIIYVWLNKLCCKYEKKHENKDRNEIVCMHRKSVVDLHLQDKAHSAKER
jgi:hypothetical protein